MPVQLAAFVLGMFHVLLSASNNEYDGMKIFGKLMYMLRYGVKSTWLCNVSLSSLVCSWLMATLMQKCLSYP